MVRQVKQVPSNQDSESSSPQIGESTQTGLGRRRMSVGKALGIVTATALPVITLAALTIPIITNMAETESSQDTLRTSMSGTPPAVTQADVAPAEVMGSMQQYRHSFGTPGSEEHEAYEAVGGIWVDWLLPVDAPIETFPTYSGDIETGYPSCMPDQIAWLNEFAVRAAEYNKQEYKVNIVNDSTTGGAISLSDIRFEGQGREVVPRIHFMCQANRGAGAGQVAKLRTDGSSAVYGEDLWASKDAMPEGSVVTLNIEPGATEVLVLDRVREPIHNIDYSGSIIASMILPEAQEVVLAEDITLTAFAIEGFSIMYSPSVHRSGFQCVEDGVAYGECDREGAAKHLAAAAAAASNG